MTAFSTAQKAGPKPSIPQRASIGETRVDYVPPGQATTDEFTTAYRASVLAAAKRVAESRRGSTISFSVSIDPTLTLRNFVSLLTGPITGSGKVVRVAHKLDIDAGSAITEAEVECVSVVLPSVPAPVRQSIPSAIKPGALAAEAWTWIGGMVESRPWDETSMFGFSSNIASPVPGSPKYPEQFSVRVPGIEEAAQGVVGIPPTCSMRAGQELITALTSTDGFAVGVVITGAGIPTPDYFQTFGLGFFEYFQLAEDIGAEPLPILNCGMACQFNSAELVPLDELDPYIQDALDLIEFANGAVNTKWGKVRTGMGHPEPFNLKMMGVGNENWGPQYIERLKVFTKAIKAKYPQVKVVASSGTDPSGDRFNYLNTELRNMNTDIIDEHYYRKPEWFLENASRYDNYDRNGSKVFAGEYAGHSDKTVNVIGRNNVRSAIAEAAFLTGLERNADVVVMASYAPLFAHIDGWQWTPDLISIDNLRSIGTVNYYIQKLYSTNKGTHAVPALMNDKPAAGQDSLYVSSVIDKNTGEVIVKTVNSSISEKKIVLALEGVSKISPVGLITILAGKPDETNTLDNPQAVKPVEKTIPIKGKKLDVQLKPYSFTIIKVGRK